MPKRSLRFMGMTEKFFQFKETMPLRRVANHPLTGKVVWTPGPAAGSLEFYDFRYSDAK